MRPGWNVRGATHVYATVAYMDRVAASTGWQRGTRFGWQRVVCTLLCALLGGAEARAVKPPKPEVEIDLQSMGYMGYSSRLADDNLSLLTAYFVDAGHVLVTFHARSLVARSAEDKTGDQVRNIAAVLLEVPSGKVLARTEWHVFDYARYLWPLGDGRFLLRIRNTLRVLDPMPGLTAGDAFQQQMLLHEPGTLVALGVSPVGHVMTLQIAIPRKRLPLPGDMKAVGDSTVTTDANGPVMMHFLRLEAGTGRGLIAAAAGKVRAPQILRLPLDDAGFLLSEQGARDEWNVNFDAFDGKRRDLGAVDSSCPPLLEFASRSQFVALECRGSEEKLALSAFDFQGNELWQERFVDDSHNFNFRFSPDAGRFAVSRSLNISREVNSEGTPQGPSQTQELRVYSVHGGDLLFQGRYGQETREVQNFDLSSDGMRLLCVHGGKLALWSLPKLKRSEEKDIADAKQQEPPQGSGPIEVAALEKRGEQGGGTPVGAGAVQAAAVSGTSTGPVSSANNRAAGDLTAAVNAPPVSPEGGLGDSNGARKRPTLLNPGERAEFGEKAPR